MILFRRKISLTDEKTDPRDLNESYSHVTRPGLTKFLNDVSSRTERPWLHDASQTVAPPMVRSITTLDAGRV